MVFIIYSPPCNKFNICTCWFPASGSISPSPAPSVFNGIVTAPVSVSSNYPILPSSSFQPEADVTSLPDVSTEKATSQSHSQSISSSTTTGDYSIPGTVIQTGISTVLGQSSIPGSIQSSATTWEVYSTSSVVVTGTLIFFYIFM